MHEPTSLNPFDGQRGFWGRLNRITYRFTGPAQIGIGRPEAPYVPPANPLCPLCDAPMSEHVIDRGNARIPTYVSCPAK